MQDSLSLVLGVLHAGARSVQLSTHFFLRFLCQVTGTGCSASPGLLTARSWPRAARTARWVLAPWCPSSWAGGESGGVQSGLAQETLRSSGLKQNATSKVGARGFRGEDLFSLAAWARQVSGRSEQDFLCPGGALRADAS